MCRLKWLVRIGALAVIATVTAAAVATTPGSNGQIAFRRWLNDETSRSAPVHDQPGRNRRAPDRAQVAAGARRSTRLVAGRKAAGVLALSRRRAGVDQRRQR